jgi:hypothetical protein
MITYTELVICVKFVFQFGFWEWNTPTGSVSDAVKTYKPQNIIGIQRLSYFAVADVALLIALFFHRSMLRKLGLWKDANNQSTEFSSPKKRPMSTVVSVDQDTLETGSTEAGQNSPSPITRSPNGDSAVQGENVAVRRATKPGKKKGHFMQFTDQLLRPKFRYIRDLYPVMFFLDVFCFLIVAFNYTSFVEGSSGNFISYIQVSSTQMIRFYEF